MYSLDSCFKNVYFSNALLQKLCLFTFLNNKVVILLLLLVMVFGL